QLIRSSIVLEDFSGGPDEIRRQVRPVLELIPIAWTRVVSRDGNGLVGRIHRKYLNPQIGTKIKRSKRVGTVRVREKGLRASCHLGRRDTWVVESPIVH